MKWDKKGKICSHETLDLPWFKKNIMVPVPCRLDEKTLRLFVTFCDEENIGRIGYVDVEADDPSRVTGYSRNPVLDIGLPGSFDDHGVVTASLVEQPDELWLYYSGYQMAVEVPYVILSGLAVSRDGGLSARRIQAGPVLPALPDELNSRCAPVVLKENFYKMWYTGDYDSGWRSDAQGKMMPWYLTKYLESDDGLHWDRAPARACLKFADDDEHGLAKPTLWCEDGLYKMIYSIRSLSGGYRLGYAESADGIRFVRKDGEAGLDVSADGWDSEMVCFAARYEHGDRVYLFYCGNRYGQGGLGYAELERR